MPEQPPEAPAANAWPDTRTTGLALAGILVLALALRLVYVLQMQANPYFFEPAMDALYHVEWARAFANGDTFDPGRPFFRGPLYPWCLGLVFKVFGDNLLVPRILQALLGTTTALLCFLIGRDVFDRRVGLLAALLAASYWVLIYFDGELLITALVVPLNMLGLWLTLRLREAATPRRAALAGLCWGLSALARPQVLLVMPFLGCWLWARHRPQWRTGLLPVLALVLGTCLPIAPVSIYNASLGDPSLIASGGGVNLWIGNNPRSDGSSAIVPGTRPGWWQGYHDAIAMAEAKEGRKLKASEVSSHYVGRALDHISNSPGQALRHFGWKFRLFWSNWELGNNQPIHYFAHQFGGIVNFLPVGFWLLAPLGILGLLLCMRRRAAATFVLWSFVLVQMTTVVAFFVCARFRVPILPVLMILGAFATFELLRMFRQRRWPALGGAAAVLLGSGLFVALVPAAVDRSDGSAMRQLGVIAQERGEFRKALSYYRRAVAEPNVPKQMVALLHKDLGATLCELNQLAEAERELQTALKIEPNQGEALSALTCLYLDHAKQPKEALRVAKVMVERKPSYGRGFYDLGRCHVALNQLSQAVTAFETGLRIGNVEFECAVVLGKLADRNKQPEQAEAYFRRALAARQQNDSWYFSTAKSLVENLLRRGQRRDAQQFVTTLAAKLPGHPEVGKLQALVR